MGCVQLDAVLHSNQELQKILTRFVLVYLDTNTNGNEVQQIEGITRIPVLIFYSPSGNEISRKVGYRNPDELSTLFKQISSQLISTKWMFKGWVRQNHILLLEIK